MSDDLFPGFESHWIDTEAGRIFARSKGERPAARAAARLSADPCDVAPHRAGARGNAPGRLHGPARLRLVVSAPKGDAAHETYSKRAMGRDVVAVMEALGPCALRGGRARSRARGSATASPSIIRAGSSGSSLLDILPTSHVWAQMKAGQVPAGPLGLSSREPFPKPEEEIGRDPLPYFEGLMANGPAAGDLSAFDPRALRAYRDELQRADPHPRLLRGLPRRRHRDIEADEADLAAGRTINCPTQLIWSEFYLVRGTSGGAAPAPRRLAADLRARSHRASAISSGHFVAEENPGATLEALQRDSCRGRLIGRSHLAKALSGRSSKKRPQQVRRLRLPGCRRRPPGHGGRSAAGRSARRSRPRRPWGRRAEIDPADAREGDRGGAHGAGFERHVEVAAGQALVAQRLAGPADGEHFGMRGGIAAIRAAGCRRRR